MAEESEYPLWVRKLVMWTKVGGFILIVASIGGGIWSGTNYLVFQWHLTKLECRANKNLSKLTEIVLTANANDLRRQVGKMEADPEMEEELVDLVREELRGAEEELGRARLGARRDCDE